jgi:hypothetical protein
MTSHAVSGLGIPRRYFHSLSVDLIAEQKQFCAGNYLQDGSQGIPNLHSFPYFSLVYGGESGCAVLSILKFAEQSVDNFRKSFDTFCLKEVLC